MGEDRRAVLGADIRPLAVALGGVVHAKEQLDQGAIGHLGRIEGHLDHLGMIGLIIADLFVGRVLGGAAGIAGHGIDHAWAPGGRNPPPPKSSLRRKVPFPSEPHDCRIAPIIRALRGSVTAHRPGARAGHSGYRSAWLFPSPPHPRKGMLLLSPPFQPNRQFRFDMNLSSYLTGKYEVISACRAVARGYQARLRPSGCGVAAFDRFASEDWEGP